MKFNEMYHPEKFRKSRPFANDVAKIYKNLNFKGTPNIGTSEGITNLIRHVYNETISKLPLEQRPTNLVGVSGDINVAMHYASFCYYGKQIFHFNPEIVEQFRKTDIDEVRLANLQFPYEVFYMSFGRQLDMNLWNEGCFIDGAYITKFNDPRFGIQILLTTVYDSSISIDNKFTWIFNSEKYYYLTIPLNDMNQPVVEATDMAIEKDMERRYQLAHKPPPTHPDPNVIVFNRRPLSIQTELKKLEEGYSVFRESLRLIINSLCYITAYPDDIEKQYPKDTPPVLFDDLKNARKPKEIEKAKSKLASMGYTKIHFCGKSFKILDSNSLPTRKELKTHWRRGHWRNQVYGTNLIKRKLIWIMPVIVHKDKIDSQQELGHIYTVDIKMNKN